MFTWHLGLGHLRYGLDHLVPRLCSGIHCSPQTWLWPDWEVLRLCSLFNTNPCLFYASVSPRTALLPGRHSPGLQPYWPFSCHIGLGPDTTRTYLPGFLFPGYTPKEKESTPTFLGLIQVRLSVICHLGHLYVTSLSRASTGCGLCFPSYTMRMSCASFLQPPRISPPH